MAGRKKLTPNAQRRAMARAADKLMRDRQKLAALSSGGAPDRPVEVSSASLVEPKARSFECLRCGALMSVEQHAAETIGGRRLRVVSLGCAACGHRRTAYFAILASALN